MRLPSKASTGTDLDRLRSRYAIAALAMLAAVMSMLAAVALGLDALAVVLGAAIATAAMAVVVGAWLEPARRRAGRAERRAGREERAQGRRTRRAIHAAERRSYSQVEALAWLRDELDLRSPLPPLRGAAASPDLLLELLRIIDRNTPGLILELGSGASTVVMAARCKSLGSGQVVALEHDASYAEATRQELRGQGLADSATVVDAPLVDVAAGDETRSWYSLGPDIPSRIELLFVDGPPATVAPLARYPALPLLRGRLAPGAVVLVDDGDRPDERRMVQRWKAEVDGLEVRYLPFAKGAWVLTMPA